MTTFRNILTAVVITASVMFGSYVARAASTDALHYTERNGNGPTIVIRGEGFATTEDSVELRLVDYDPTHNRVIYRVVVP